MKKLIVLLIIAGAVGYLIWHGFQAREAEPHDEAEAEHVAKSADGQVVVAMDAETQKLIQLKVEPLAEGTLRATVTGFGRVIDPSPLAALDSDLAAAMAAENSSRAEAERAAALFQTGQTVAKKVVESAQAQFRADQTKTMALTRRIALEWGSTIASLSTEERQKLIEQLVKNETALVHVDLPAGEVVTQKPVGARLTVIGREDQPVAASDVSIASMVDPKTQAQGFLLRVDAPPFPLLPGAAVTAWLELPGEAQKGAIIPRGAVVRVGGLAWVFVQTDDEHFARRAIEVGAPMESGFFQREHFAAGEKVVVTGAQAVLSEELKSQMPEE